jgi:hypothetical protein
MQYSRGKRGFVVQKVGFHLIIIAPTLFFALVFTNVNIL